MGRKKIRIARITDERNRSVTYLKRKAGLMKKAHELAVLTDSEVAVIVFGKNGKLAEFCSVDIDQMLLRYTQYDGAVESKGPSFYFAQAANPAESDDENEEVESVKPTDNEPVKPTAGPSNPRGSKRKVSSSTDGSVSGRGAQKRLSTGLVKADEGAVALAQRRQSKEEALTATSTRNGVQQDPQAQQQQLPPPQLHPHHQQQASMLVGPSSLNLQPLEPSHRHLAYPLASSNQGYNTYTGPGPHAVFSPQVQQQQHGSWGWSGGSHGTRQLSLNASLEARVLGGYGELAGGPSSAGGGSGATGEAAFFPLEAVQGYHSSAKLPTVSHYSAYARDHAPSAGTAVSALAQQRHSLPLLQTSSSAIGYATSPASHVSTTSTSTQPNASGGPVQTGHLPNPNFHGLQSLMGIGVPLPHQESHVPPPTAQAAPAQAQGDLFQQHHHRPST